MHKNLCSVYLSVIITEKKEKRLLLNLLLQIKTVYELAFDNEMIDVKSL